MHIDGWTLLLQTVNLLVLMALLRWLLYRPLLGVIDARQRAVGAELARADAARTEAQREATALAGERRALAEAREQVLATARHDAALEAETARAQRQALAEAALRDGQTQLDRERRQARGALFEEAAEVARALSLRLLSQAAGDRVDDGFVDALLHRLDTTPASERATWWAGGAPPQVDLVSAHPLDAARQARIRERLVAVLGAGTDVGFRHEPALVAGAELRFPQGRLACHWAAELAAARQRMRAAAETPHE